MVNMWILWFLYRQTDNALLLYFLGVAIAITIVVLIGLTALSVKEHNNVAIFNNADGADVNGGRLTQRNRRSTLKCDQAVKKYMNLTHTITSDTYNIHSTLLHMSNQLEDVSLQFISSS